VLSNRRFLAFAAAMTGSYLLLYQTYQAIPLETRRLAPDGNTATIVVGALFAVSGAIAIAGQLRITDWCRRHWSSARCLTAGLSMMSVAFLLPLLTATTQPTGSFARSLVAFGPLFGSVVLLTLGSVVVFPFEMDTIVTLAGDRLVATHYGLYNTICGIGIAAGTFGTGAVLDISRDYHMTWLPWATLAAIGSGCVLGVHYLGRTGRLQPRTATAVSAV